MVCAVFHGVVGVTSTANGVLVASPLTFGAVVGFQCLAALLLRCRLAAGIGALTRPAASPLRCSGGRPHGAA